MEKELSLEQMKFRWMHKQRHFVKMRSFFLLVRTLKIYEKPLGFPFQMDYEKVNKLHLDDNWVSNGPKLALRKHYKNQYKTNILAHSPKTMVEIDAGFQSDLKYSQRHVLQPSSWPLQVFIWTYSHRHFSER